jgi:hypothetical protein
VTRKPARIALVVALAAAAVTVYAHAASAASHTRVAQWALDRLDQTEHQTSDLRYRWEDALSGDGATIYVLSDGTSEISELSGRVRPGLAFGGARNADPIADECHRDPGLTDGTALAALAAGSSRGVARDATVRGLQIPYCYTSYGQSCTGNMCQTVPLYHETLDLNDYAEAIRWVTVNGTRPAVGLFDAVWSGANAAIEQALRDSVAAGVTWVVPAGDAGGDACGHTPAALGGGLDGLVTIGATGIDDFAAAGTNTGGCVDLFAPGKDVDSPSSTLTTGTRLAAAYTAGVVAQFLEGAAPGTAPGTVEAVALKANATLGKLGVPSGSPNLLLHSAWWGPVVWLNCENAGYAHGHGNIACEQGDLNGLSGTQRWSRDATPRSTFNDQSSILDACTVGHWHLYKVDTVRNGQHDSASVDVECEGTAL